MDTSLSSWFWHRQCESGNQSQLKCTKRKAIQDTKQVSSLRKEFKFLVLSFLLPSLEFKLNRLSSSSFSFQEWLRVDFVSILSKVTTTLFSVDLNDKSRETSSYSSYIWLTSSVKPVGFVSRPVSLQEVGRQYKNGYRCSLIFQSCFQCFWQFFYIPNNDSSSNNMGRLAQLQGVLCRKLQLHCRQFCSHNERQLLIHSWSSSRLCKMHSKLVVMRSLHSDCFECRVDLA